MDENMALEVIKLNCFENLSRTSRLVISDAIQGLEYSAELARKICVFLAHQYARYLGNWFGRRCFQRKPVIVFTTAFSDFCGEALNSMHWIFIKSLSSQSLSQGMSKSSGMEICNQRKKMDHYSQNLWREQKNQSENFSELLFCEAAGNYVTFQLESEKLDFPGLTFRGI